MFSVPCIMSNNISLILGTFQSRQKNRIYIRGHRHRQHLRPPLGYHQGPYTWKATCIWDYWSPRKRHQCHHGASKTTEHPPFPPKHNDWPVEAHRTRSGSFYTISTPISPQVFVLPRQSHDHVHGGSTMLPPHDTTTAVSTKQSIHCQSPSMKLSWHGNEQPSQADSAKVSRKLHDGLWK